MKKRIKRSLLFILLMLLLICSIPFPNSGYVLAAEKRLSLGQAQAMALAYSATRVKISNKIELQEIKYAAAVKSIKMKKKNMLTFRWSPLLSFKFPEKPTLADEFEWQYKPMQITCTITELKHQLRDEIFASKETVSNLYVALYIEQTKIAYMEDNLELAEANLQKNRARLATGNATQSDIDKMEQSIKRLTTEISLQKRNFEADKSKLSKLINLDVTTGYRFANPLQEAEIPRSVIDNLVTYTLQNNQSYYEAKLDTRLAYTSMNMMESMMRKQYGKKMNVIMPYINQIKAGERVDSGAFKSTYKQMLKDIDEPWSGEWKILFLRIKKEWFKGAIDGSRYVEDDPYALYSGALEYADAQREEDSIKSELTTQVRSGFETLKTAQIAYQNAMENAQQIATDLEKSKRLNLLGQVSYEELSQQQEEYREQELDALDLLAEYSKLLYSYDRLTCGGITAYLEGTDIDMKAAQGGNSFLAQELKGEVYYFIDYKIEDNIFTLGVSVPETYTLDISDFALYVDGTKIGNTTPIGEVLEHLALDLDQVETTQIYLYDDEELVDICTFDASVNQDVLEVTGGYTLVNKQSMTSVANYSYTLQESIGTVTITITPKQTGTIAYYQITDTDGNAVFKDELIPIEEGLTYLSILVTDLSELQIMFYDSEQQELYQGIFETGSSAITAVTN